MKMAIKFGLVLGMVLVICSWSAGVSAQERKLRESTHLQDMLELTEAQMTAIHAEQQAAGTRINTFRKQVQQLEEQVYQAAEETGDPATVGRLVLEKIALQKQIRSEEAALRDSINSVLTPAQQDKLKQLRAAGELSRDWEALMSTEERLQRHEGVPGGGGRPHRERPPKN
jgi:Spy/CpxP family protein refolding chaperone